MTSYISIQDAIVWFRQRDDDSWPDLSPEAQAAYLLKASEWIDRYFTFRGRKQDHLQQRSWPRDDAYRDDGSALTGLPRELLDAVLMLAPIFAESDEAAEASLGIGRRIKQQKIGGVEVVFDKASGRELTRIQRLLMPLLIPRHQQSVRRS
jgi:hypothetical protein